MNQKVRKQIDSFFDQRELVPLAKQRLQKKRKKKKMSFLIGGRFFVFVFTE